MKKYIACGLLLSTLTVSATLGGFGCATAAETEETAATAPLPTPKYTVWPFVAPLPANDPNAGEINAFQDADKKQMPPQNAVLFLGSSSIRLWETLARDFPEIPVINRGFGGSLIQDSVHVADRIVYPYKPKIIVFFAGTNDLDYGNKSPEQAANDFKTLATNVHQNLPDTRIVYLSINPTNARWKQEDKVVETNKLIRTFIEKTNSPTQKLNFIDSHSALLGPDGKPQAALLREDGLHLNAKGYEEWTKIIHPLVIEWAKKDGVEFLKKDATK